MERDQASGPGFGTLLRAYRLAAGLSQEALAERARMSAVGVGALERGDRQAPYRDTVLRLARALELPPEEQARLEGASARPRRVSRPPAKCDDESCTPLHNLPLTPTSFLGRERELSALRELVPESRLVTVIGPGGVGKTRLVLETARRLTGAFADGVWFVGLAPLPNAEPLLRTVAQTLRVRFSGEESAHTELIDALRGRRALIVLDNCEHMIEAVAALVNTILETCPHIVVLATSRQGLKVPGEQIYRLPSLSAPMRGAHVSAMVARRFDAVSLFVERARAGDPHFGLNDENAQVIAEITRRLDGLPLAIELAAAQTGIMSLPQLAQRLDERFRLLAGGSRTVLPRQQTLRAAIDWSYDLLSERERLLLNRLSIFARGSTLEAVEAVCAGGALEALEVVAVLSSLVEKSLVVAEVQERSTRYWLLDSTEAYALEKLIASGERGEFERKHAEWVAALVHDVPERSWAERRPNFLLPLRPEVDNLRAALRFTLDGAPDPGFSALGGAIAGNLASFWFRDAPDEGKRWCEIALARLNEEEHPQVVAQLNFALAVLTYAKRSVEYAECAAVLFERLGDRCGLARSLTVLADGQQETGHIASAEASLARALALFSQAGLARTWRVAVAQSALGRIMSMQGRASEARACFAEALAVSRSLSDEVLTGRAQVEQADAEFASGNAKRALDVVLDLAHLPQLSGTDVAAAALVNAAAYALELGDVLGAQQAAQEGLERARRLQLKNLTIFAIQHLAACLVQQGDARRAAMLRGYTDAWFTREGFQREPTEAKSYLVLNAALQGCLSAEMLAGLAAEGARLSDDQALNEALAAAAA